MAASAHAYVRGSMVKFYEWLEGSPERHCLVDVKQAIAAAAPRDADAARPGDNAERVVEGARHISPHLGRRMLAAHMLDRSVFVRELLPQDLKLEIESLTRDEAMEDARYLASPVGRAHGRQTSALDRKVWRRCLERRR